MKPESIVFAIAGSLFGLIVGWILGHQQAITSRPALTPQAQQTAAPPANNSGTPPAAPLDEGRVQAMRTVAEQNPKDAEPRVQLGNLYFDAERYPDAITWYEEALKLSPSDPNL